MVGLPDHSEERLGELLGLLPAVPRGWSEAARDLPRARRQLDTIVERCERDAAFRAAVVADLEAALSAEGYVVPASLRAELSERLAGGN
jgi:hypothetical protein